MRGVPQGRYHKRGSTRWFPQSWLATGGSPKGFPQFGIPKGVSEMVHQWVVPKMVRTLHFTIWCTPNDALNWLSPKGGPPRVSPWGSPTGGPPMGVPEGVSSRGAPNGGPNGVYVMGAPTIISNSCVPPRGGHPSVVPQKRVPQGRSKR